MTKVRFPHHEAVRDTYWVGKNTPAPWLIVMVIVIAAGLLAHWLS